MMHLHRTRRDYRLKLHADSHVMKEPLDAQNTYSRCAHFLIVFFSVANGVTKSYEKSSTTENAAKFVCCSTQECSDMTREEEERRNEIIEGSYTLPYIARIGPWKPPLPRPPL